MPDLILILKQYVNLRVNEPSSFLRVSLRNKECGPLSKNWQVCILLTIPSLIRCTTTHKFLSASQSLFPHQSVSNLRGVTSWPFYSDKTNKTANVQ